MRLRGPGAGAVMTAMRTALRSAPLRAVVGAALLALAGPLVVLPHPAASAVVRTEPPQRTITYDVRVRGPVQADVGAFARMAARTFADRRGWSLGGSLRFRQVASGGAFTLWLAAPSALPSFSPVCSAQYSCRAGRNVIVNDERWRRGTASWPTVREYRQYVLNHELGHWLGLGHVSCPAAGAPAPVMVQQSKGVGSCRTSTWPTEQERRAAAAGARVAVRPKTPALLAVKRAGTRGTEVHALAGASTWATWLAHEATSLPRTEGQPWTFRVADHDRDGVDDLYAVEHRSGANVRVRVLGGASGLRTPLLDVVTPLRVSDGRTWTFAVADQDGDGHDDLYAVDGQGAAGTEVHVLDGATRFRTWRLHAATALHRTAAADWSLSVGDHDRDGIEDLYAIARRGSSGRVEVHVLSGAAGFRRWLVHSAAPLGPAPAQDWSFEVADHDGDGFDQVVAVHRSGARRTEVHVLDRAARRVVLRRETALERSTGESRWSFDLS